jgi:LuxR family maltose regulon positive regulatory protein
LGLASVYQAQGFEDLARATLELVAGYLTEMNNLALLSDVEAYGAHLSLLQGRKAEAERWAERANRAIRPSSMPMFYTAPFALPEVLLAKATHASLEEASRLLAHLREIVQATHNTRFLIEVLALQALLYDARHEQSAALQTLKQAVTLAEPGGLVRVFVDLGPKMAGLLHQLAAGREASRFVARLLEAFPPARPPEPALRQTGLIEPLSERELEVLELLAQRLSNKEIAHALSISPMTVKRHTVNIYQKLLVQGRREAVARAIALGILPQPPRG